MKTPLPLLLGALALCAPLHGDTVDGSLGLFTDHGDVGSVGQPGTVVYDASRGTYTVGGAGANMWAKADAMQFVWKKVSGNLSIAADIAWVGASSQPHRKACLVIRQSLDVGSPYVDVAYHGSGLTSLQYRAQADGMTKEIEAMTDSPTRVRLDRIGDQFYLSVGYEGGKTKPSGASYTLHLKDPVYVGLAVCAHDNSAFETAVFSKVKLGGASRDAAAPQPGLHVMTLPTGDQRVTDK